MNGIYAILIYLSSSLHKPEHAMSQLMKNASKESYRRNIWEKLSAIGDAFITKHEVSTHKTIKPVLSCTAENLEY